jgi:GT2 family glycosyltransferase
VADVAVVVLSYNTREVTTRCLRELLAAKGPIAVEVVVVDNASGDGSADAIAIEFPGVRLIRNARNRGFAAAVNQAVSVTRAPALLLLNSDCFLGEPSAAGELLSRAFDGLFSRPKVAALGVAVVTDTGQKYVSARPFPTLSTYLTDKLHTGGPYPVPPPDGVWREAAEVDWINGAFWLINRKGWEAVGPLDERYFFGWEDIDWAFQARLAGWRILHDPRLRVTHIGGESARRRKDDVIVGHNLMLNTYLTGREKFWRKNYGWLSTQAMRAASIAMSAPKWLRAALMGNANQRAAESIRIAHALGYRDPKAPGEKDNAG